MANKPQKEITKTRSTIRKPVRKVVKKQPASEIIPSEEFVTESTFEESSEKFPGKSLLRKKIIIPVLVILVIIVLANYFKGVFVAATVNGEPIYRMSVVGKLEKAYGKQFVTSEVTRILILQEAKKKNIEVADKDIDTEIKTIETNLTKNGQSLDQILQSRGMSKDELRDQIKLQKLAEKILNIKVTDAEVNKFIEENKNSFPENTTPEEMKTMASEQVKQTLFSEKFQTWLADVQKKASINYFVTY